MENTLLATKNNIQEMKIREGWRGLDVTPEGYKLDNEGNQLFINNLCTTSTLE